MYAEVISIHMVDIAEEFDSELPIEEQALEENPQADDEMVTEDHQSANAVVTKDQFFEKMEVDYPKAEEDLIDFLNKCKIANTNAMLCPRCSVVFD